MRRPISLLFVLVSLTAQGQESLALIVDRGYVAEWLVCGPFEPDADGGILAAVRDGRAPLDSTDFMASVGGIARVRPAAGMKVKAEAGDVAWQRARADDPSFDLAPLFPEAREGIVYAAFYADVRAQQTVYFDLQSVLGARVFANGFPMRAVRAAAVSAAGLDRFLLTFQRGTNLVVLEIPGATFEGLAELTGTDVADLKAWGFQNRPLLRGKSGFEFALRILPTREFSGLAVVPRLRNANTFSGYENDLRQEVVLSLFNPQSVPSPPIVASTRVAGGKSFKTQISAIAPESVREVLLSIPRGTALAGQSLRVTVDLKMSGASTQFSTNVTALERPASGKVYVVAGARAVDGGEADQSSAVRLHLDRFSDHMKVLERELFYGFDLGAVGQWRPAFNLYPEHRGTLFDAVGEGRVAAHAGYTTPDERIVSGETLIRNLLYGRDSTQTLLNDWNPAYVAWDAPAIAPQTIQILADAGVMGVISNLRQRGVPALSYQLSPNGARLLHRRKKAAASPLSDSDLRDMAILQRREALGQGLRSDVLISESIAASPEAFWVGSSATLARSVPNVIATGAGARRFLEDAAMDLGTRGQGIHRTGRGLTAYELGSLIARLDLRLAFTQSEALVLSAEKFATIAALMGADYPDASLDMAWRQLLYSSDPKRVGFAPTSRIYLDTLASSREAAAYGSGVLANAVGFIARGVDTNRDALSKEADIQAIVVFNPSSFTRTDLCAVDLVLDTAPGLALVDEVGDSIPFTADRLRISDNTLQGARVRFVAEDVPSLGYKVYYLSPRGVFPPTQTADDSHIENEFFRLTVDPNRGGGIVSIVDKQTEAELVDGIWNDIVLIAEDASRTRGGRDLWTTGETFRASSSPAKVESTKQDGAESLTATVSVVGGRIVRTLTLYAGIPVVYCETRFEGLADNKDLWVATFSTEDPALAPVHGERFGAQVGRKSPEPLVFRTEGAANVSGTAAHPALRWTALSPNDHLRVDRARSVSLGPTTIIHGDGEIMLQAAERIQRALVQRGIPADTFPDTARTFDAVWSDSSEFVLPNEDLDYGSAFRIVLGDPDQNEFTSGLFGQRTTREIERFTGALSDGASLFFYDTDVPDGRPPVPTLLLSGVTPSRTATMAVAFANSIARGGIYRIPEEAFIVERPTAYPERGLALLLKGAGVSSAEQDGTLALLLRHAAEWGDDKSAANTGVSGEMTAFEYGIFPFAGTWREGGVVHAAHAYNEPFVTTATDLHSGPHPPVQSFLTVQPAPFVLTSLRPAEAGVAKLRTAKVDPKEGIIARGYESTGQAVTVQLSFTAGLFGASRANVLDTEQGALAVRGSLVEFRADGFDIASLLLRPAGLKRRAGDRVIGVLPDASGPVFTRYWRHNSGAAPYGNQPLSVVLKGELDNITNEIVVLVANNLIDESIKGVLSLSTPAGWKVSPEQVEYNLGPGAFSRTTALLIRPQLAEKTGGLVARTSYGGRMVQDLLSLDTEPVEMSVSRNGEEIEVMVKNRSSLPAEGFVDMIVPSAHWTELAGHSETTVNPRRAAVYVSPFGVQRILFRASGPEPDFWMVAKLAANGSVVYRRVD